jgi:uncharacterized membrane protein
VVLQLAWLQRCGAAARVAATLRRYGTASVATTLRYNIAALRVAFLLLLLLFFFCFLTTSREKQKEKDKKERDSKPVSRLYWLG